MVDTPAYDTAKEVERSIRLPGWTCPLIDSVIDKVKDAMDGLDACEKEIGKDYEDVKSAQDALWSVNYDLKDIYSKLSAIEAVMEKIREANRDLRDGSDKWSDSYTELENTISAYIKEVEEETDRLEQENEDLRDQVEQLQEALEETNQKEAA